MSSLEAEFSALERIARSVNYRDGKFINTLETAAPPFWSTFWDFLKGVKDAIPEVAPPVVKPEPRRFVSKDSIAITWMGHSTLLAEMDGARILFDPVWSQRVSPVPIVGPKRFHAPPIALEELPLPDAVVISHDHYDHLDWRTVTALAARGARFIVPLGVGAHLARWGITTRVVIELDWWEQVNVGNVTLVAVPARHFSGRSPFGTDKDATLWAGWAVIGPYHRVYYSGDTAMFPGIREIGARFGPFDLTMIEIGAYDRAWRDYHLGPEQAVEAHQIVRGKLMLPVHWGTFNLALHAWTEPVERLTVAAKAAGISIALPKPGQRIECLNLPLFEKWWPDLPWKTAEEAPVISSRLDAVAGQLTPVSDDPNTH